MTNFTFVTTFKLNRLFIGLLFLLFLSKPKTLEANITLSPVMGCELDILTAYTDNCTGDNTNGYTADWNIGIRVIDPIDNEISFQQNSETVLTATLAGATETLLIPGIVADGGIYDTLKVWFTNDPTCADMIVVKRPLPCPADVSACSSASGCLGGNSFDDLNCNGTKETELGVMGIQVNVSDCNNMTTTVYTDSDGDWEVCGLTDGEQYRIEFIMPKRISCWAKPTHTGSDNGSDVQFVTAPACANFGLSDAADYCEENPNLATPCYVNGDPLAGGTSGALDAFVSFPYNADGNSLNPTHLAFANEIGATWGVAYQRSSQTIFTSAVIKRHVGLGDVTGDAIGDIGGIWTIDPTSASVTKWLDVTTLGVNLGTDPHSGLSADWTDPSYDENTFDAIGKQGIGDIDISEDGQRLYVMNLNDKELLEIDIASKTLLNSYPVNNPGCGDMEDVRPWGIEIHHNEIYIGVVCSGQSTSSRADVSAHVMQLDQSNSTFYNVLSLDDMTYLRGEDTPGWDSTDDLSVEAWFAWTDQWNPGRRNFNDNNLYYAQPILSDIEFTENGDMIIAFLDRCGMQGGQDNFSIDTNDADLYATTSAGSVLKACWDGSIWNIEQNGVCGGTVGYGTGTFGPGGGEFFEDEYSSGGHTERFLGAIAYRMGSDTLIGTAFNPINASYSGGTFGVSVANGERATRYQVYEDSQDGTFAKATGLGDIEVLCGLAPLEIGNYVWCDSLKNGLQDACERGINDLNVHLYNDTGILVGTTMTANQGQYYFNQNNVDITGVATDGTPNSGNYTGLDYSATYYLVFGDGQFAADELTIGADIYTLSSLSDVNANANDNIDSDLNSGTLTNSLGGAIPDGLPYITFVTDIVGCGNHKFDVGINCTTSECPAEIKCMRVNVTKN